MRIGVFKTAAMLVVFSMPGAVLWLRCVYITVSPRLGRASELNPGNRWSRVHSVGTLLMVTGTSEELEVVHYGWKLREEVSQEEEGVE